MIEHSSAPPIIPTSPPRPGLPASVPGDWYQRDVATVLASLETSLDGLNDSAAASRRATYGPNELIDGGSRSLLVILWYHCASMLVLVLFVAALLSLLLGRFFEAGAIVAMIAMFVILGAIQDYRAERSIIALKRLATPTVRVYRNGMVQALMARDLVPGDVIALEAGDVVPADLRIIESFNLRMQESALTGESEPVEKLNDAIVQPNLPPVDRQNMAYMGTQVVYGHGRAVVVSTGMRSELGRIATLLQSLRLTRPPLQQRLDRLGKTLALAGSGLAAGVLLMGLLRAEQFSDSLLTAISVMVAIIPEGLPVVVIFTLALAARQMLRQNVLVRKLPATETLGAATVICADKTGTLTENRMAVRMIDVAGHRVDLAEALCRHLPVLTPSLPLPELRIEKPVPIRLLLASGALCNDATLVIEATTGQYNIIGDPIEGALLVAAAYSGLIKETLQQAMPRVVTLPFDRERQLMTTVHRRSAYGMVQELRSVWGTQGLEPGLPYIAITRGVLDELLALTTQIWEDDRVVPLTDVWRARIHAASAEMTHNGMYVLGIAFRPLASAKPSPEMAQNLIFIGLVGMIDPPRPAARLAVQGFTAAGIRPLMITGDHSLTASYIARDLNIAADETVITGAQLNQMSDSELARVVQRVSVFARATPEHKLKIVQALQQQGHVVAMIGDGVNDSPALKQADIGIAMGNSGTDVAKESADMILRDDNVATIVAAVEEGRVIYDNLRRFVKFAVAGNIGKLTVMLCWPLSFMLLGLPLTSAVALVPLQLLWLNLIADGLLGLSMGIEPAEKQVMQRPPCARRVGFFSGGVAFQVLWVGLFSGLLALGIGFVYYVAGLPQWQTMMVTTLVLLQICHALAVRSNREALLSIGLLSNRLMTAVIGLILALHLAALYLPVMSFLQLLPLTLTDVLICCGLGLLLLIAVEIEKRLLYR